MILRNRIEAFSELGEILRNSLSGRNFRHSPELNRLIETQHLKNPWFTQVNVRLAVEAISDKLTEENLIKWTSSYPFLNKTAEPVAVGVIMAGNIPLAGFHDFLSVLISGNKIIAKTSSKDSDLITYISKILCEINPGFSERIRLTAGTLSGFEAVIATGSDNSSRYFEYYFGKFPNIIRKNRNSIAVIEGQETDSELEFLGNDIFSYFGLGCRNVSKIYIPEGYDLSNMISRWNRYSELIYHDKYAHNYDFSKAVYLVKKEKFIDTGFLLLKENQSLSSPVAVLYFEHYNTSDQFKILSEKQKEKIQCIVGRNYIPFGKAQSPDLWDYADGTDTMEFLLKKTVRNIVK
ncbi:MAG: hypothetical protein QG576_646 [Bacteroidota bacterium]|nr:hypothetical protein [Bacteroidota bacterium]